MCDARAVRIVDLFSTQPARSVRARDAATSNSSNGAPTVYLYAWNRCGRKGQRCRVLARGKMNSCLLEFEDGWRMVTSRNALRRA